MRVKNQINGNKKGREQLRIVALLIVFSITYLSNTPHLYVSDISSWFNSTDYENVELKDVFKTGSLFYEPWLDERGKEFYLHKLGHFVFYGSLSVFLFWRSSNIKTILLKLLLITAFAFLDEIHQFFVVGRSGRLMDVMFDMSSVLLFLFLIIAFGKVKKRPFKTRENQKNIKEQTS